MKVNKEQAMKAYDSWYMGGDVAPYSDEDIMRMYAGKVAKRSNIPVSKVDIWWCGPVMEYCVYIKGKWSGYLSEWYEV